MLVGDHHQRRRRDHYHHQDNGGGELDGTGIGNGDDDPSIPALTSIRNSGNNDPTVTTSTRVTLLMAPAQCWRQ